MDRNSLYNRLNLKVKFVWIQIFPLLFGAYFQFLNLVFIAWIMALKPIFRFVTSFYVDFRSYLRQISILKRFRRKSSAGTTDFPLIRQRSVVISPDDQLQFSNWYCVYMKRAVCFRMISWRNMPTLAKNSSVSIEVFDSNCLDWGIWQ